MRRNNLPQMNKDVNLTKNQFNYQKSLPLKPTVLQPKLVARPKIKSMVRRKLKRTGTLRLLMTLK